MKALTQLFDNTSSTFTYLLVDEKTKEGVMIDPVDTHLNDYLNIINNNNIKLKYVLETHAHADHITSAGNLCKSTGAIAATPIHCNISPADIQLENNQVIEFGYKQVIKALHTPGHTEGSMSFFWNAHLFTGDTLLINGCGRTDFQGGDTESLYRSITQILFGFPEATIICPGHDYHGNMFSTIGYEKNNNARIANRSLKDFTDIMNRLKLPKPSMIDKAIPANLKLGLVSHAA
ncbi:MAG TPA: Zn-dependent hydrolase [Methylophilaceae bacterium]|nr:Zn-dependent hydrolase [Methylophilaceae bacterium]